MIETGNAIRARSRARRAGAAPRASGCAPDRNYVVDSIRHPAEVEVLRARTSSFRLIWVEARRGGAPRAPARARRGPAIRPRSRICAASRSASSAATIRPRSSSSPCASSRTSRSRTTATLDDAARARPGGRCERSYFFERPGWDEYFMSIARVVASRSNCVKRKVAAVDHAGPPHHLDRLQRHAARRAPTATRAAARAATRSPRAARGSTSACARTARRTRSRRPPTTG